MNCILSNTFQKNAVTIKILCKTIDIENILQLVVSVSRKKGKQDSWSELHKSYFPIHWETDSFKIHKSIQTGNI